ncbi:DUF6879 family protein [Pilimelia anulata]|uniref:DUF6879 family protein n=1 Tax=Pilimelia anulata TaxID=53371 RepID=UPI003570DE9F
MPVPITDFYVLDGRAVILLFFDPRGAVERYVHSDESSLVEMCRGSFGAAWPLSTPHNEYRTAIVPR